MKETRSTDQVIMEVAQVLSECSGAFIEEIANKILTNKVTYLGDSLFEEEIKE